MSNMAPLKPKPKSPYKGLLSSSKSKGTTDVTRKIYMNQLPLKRTAVTKSIEDESYRKYHSSSRNIVKDLNLNFSKNLNRSQEKEPFSDRKNIEHKKNSLKNELNSGRHSKLGKNKLYSSSSKMDKYAEKSTMISTLLSTHHQRQQKHKEDLKKHQQGKNCRVIVIDGNQELQHFIEVNNMGDILTHLRKQYPKICYYRSVPIQITLDYLLTQQSIPGQFLNGQSLYLRPGAKENSFDQRQSIKLDHFQILKVIGSGGFSKVFLVRFKKNGQFYAMKVIDKDVIVKNKKKNIIMNERNIMKQTTHPFLIEMKFAFQTEKFLIFIVQYCPGGELFGLIKRYRRLSEDISRFYIIQIFLGLAYLHQNNIVYRDIKPENILLAQDGHVKVADLGLAKPDMFEGELAYSFCGSPEYMSPEMILQTGHTYPVDYYCMGALLYQLLFGLPPFYSRDPNQIYQSVLSEQLTFPQDVQISNECRSLLKGLLCKDSKQRLGSIHGVKQIFAHPWFGKNAYKTFIEKKIAPPITFDSVGRIDLDKVDEKQKKEVDQMLKAQKNENNKFKREMKNFYYDYRGLTQDYGARQSLNKENKDKLILRSSSSRRVTPNAGKYTHLFTGLNRKSSQKQLSKTLNSSRK